MLDREAIQNFPTDELDALALNSASLSEQAVALIGFQRTKQISQQSRKAWEAGDHAPMAREVRERRSEIIAGAFAEIWREYLPIRDYLRDRGLTPTHVADIGAGAAINDLFLARDHGPDFTLIDIEQSDAQYHGWAETGAGYASLDAARALLEENGVAGEAITLINPLRTPEAVGAVSPDLATSLYSCGFHYPIDGYLALFLRTVENGGAVILDLRRHYWRRKPPALETLCAAGPVTELYNDVRSIRIAVGGG